MSRDVPHETFPELSITVLLPVLNEVQLLEATIDILLDENPDSIEAIVAIVCDRTRPESLAVLQACAERRPGRIRVAQQTFGRLGGAFRCGIPHVHGSHAITMCSDLETDPHAVKDIIAAGRRQPDAIISASRWLPGGGFAGYGVLKWLGNWCFQHLAAMLHGQRATDFTNGFRLYPIEILRDFDWRCENHEFVLESLLRPMHAGVTVVEVPCKWRPRMVGPSVQGFGGYIPYLRLLLSTAVIRERRTKPKRAESEA